MENIDIKTIYKELKECINSYETQLNYLLEFKNNSNINNQRLSQYKKSYDKELIINIDKIHKKTLLLIDNENLNYEVTNTKTNDINEKHSTYAYDDCGIQ